MVSLAMILSQNPSWQEVCMHALDVIVPMVGIYLAYKYGNSKGKAN
jgi:hypothetical protein